MIMLISFPVSIDSAARFFEESISAYRSALGPQDTLTLSAQDDFSHFLLLTGQQEVSFKLRSGYGVYYRIDADLKIVLYIQLKVWAH